MRKHYSKNEERTQPDGRSSYGKAHREIIASALAATIPCYCTCEVQYGVAVCFQEADITGQSLPVLRGVRRLHASTTIPE